MKHLLLPMLLLLALAGCGGGLPPSSSVKVTVTPAQASVKVGDTVSLTGTATGFTASLIVEWWIQESRALDSNNDCGKLDSQAKVFTGCPYGFVMYHDATDVPSLATYYAPQTPGTYHVTLRMTEYCCSFESMDKAATATIEVTQ
jgi:hypothetical protein